MTKRNPALSLKSLIGGPDSDFDAAVEVSIEKAPMKSPPLAPVEADAVVVMKTKASSRSVPVMVFDEKYVLALCKDSAEPRKRTYR